MKELGTIGAHGVPAPQHVTALELGVEQGPILEICHALAVILRQQAVKVRYKIDIYKCILSRIDTNVLQVRVHGTIGAHGAPAPQHVIALELGADQEPILATNHALAAIQRHPVVKVS